MKLLHIVATPRHHKSNTLQISKCFLDTFTLKYPDAEIKTLDLFATDLPALAGDVIEAKYALLSRTEIDALKEASWGEVEARIAEFLWADVYVISTPMWNLSIPYTLKFYIDTIVQPNYLFRYTETGAEGLAKNKKMICVTSRGSDYSPNSYMHQFDFQEPYLRAIFGFVGITDIQFVSAQPMDITPELRLTAMNNVLAEAQVVAQAL